MLEKVQISALEKWYARPEVLGHAREIVDSGRVEDLEDYLQKTCLMPLGRHDKLPDFMRDEKGNTLFPTNLDPRHDEEGWQDAVEIAWAVIKMSLGVSHENVHKHIADTQKSDWDRFLESVEQRKRERQG